MANIIICADGTWNRPEKDINKDTPTNVLRLARAITSEKDEITQHVFYDWGIGSYHDNMSAGITGAGLHKNIKDGYRYLVQNYNKDDNIYLFGFSRGAYTVRALCGLINNCGILKRKDANRIEQAWSMYKSEEIADAPKGESALAFKQKYSHTSNQVHFVGVWDTVGALGIPFSFLGFFDRKDEFYDTKMGSNVTIARHALAIDEKRVDFEPTIWKPRSGTDLKQVWFSGVHCDVGGSYAPDKGSKLMASNTPLSWMMKEAQAHGLILDAHLIRQLKQADSATELTELHESRNHIYRAKKAKARNLSANGKTLLIHPSVKARYLADSNYRPEKLVDFVNKKGWEGYVGE